MCIHSQEIGMAVSEISVSTSTQPTRHIQIPELERALEELNEKVAEQKRQLSDTFRQIHHDVAQKEVALQAQLDEIPAGIAEKIEERRELLKQLTQNREDTLKKLHANRLSPLLEKHLEDIKVEMDKILSERIDFPHVSIYCDLEALRTTMEKRCCVLKTQNPYTFTNTPVCYGVEEGEDLDQLYHPTAVCIDPASQLVYVGEYDHKNPRIQIFTPVCRYVTSIYNEELIGCRSMKMDGDYIYVLTTGVRSLLKLNRNGETMKILRIDTAISGLFIEYSHLYTCASNDLAVQVYDLNLKHVKNIILKIPTSNHTVIPQDIIVKAERIYVLFKWHHDSSTQSNFTPIHVFSPGGEIIHSILTGECMINDARYFCMDSYENILVSDYDGNCIRIFSQDGVLLQCWEEQAGEIRRIVET